MDWHVIVIFFPVYAFTGWLGELVYRSLLNRELLNPGFLTGPFLPIYGSSACLILGLEQMLSPHPFVFRLALYGFTVTLIEYLTGVITEKLFGMTLWDYYDEPFNLHGKISLKYSLLWVLFIALFLLFIHPAVTMLFLQIPDTYAFYVTAVGNGVIGADLTLSVMSMSRFKTKMEYLKNNLTTLTSEEVVEMINKMKKQLYPFKSLRKNLYGIISQRVANPAPGAFARLRNSVKGDLLGSAHKDGEFISLIHDILHHDEFKRLKDFRHHDSNIYNHALKVAYVSYKACRSLGCDYRAAARGALLHDFFHYDWRKKEARPYRGGFHAFRHPRVALNTAERHFEVSPIEKDIIIKHMWPLTMFPPRYRESMVVSMMDKYVASYELMGRGKECGMI